MAYKDKIKQREYYKKKLKTNNCIDCGISIWSVSTRCRECNNKSMIGELHSDWKGGRIIKNEYVFIHKPNNTYPLLLPPDINKNIPIVRNMTPGPIKNNIGP